MKKKKKKKKKEEKNKNKETYRDSSKPSLVPKAFVRSTGDKIVIQIIPKLFHLTNALTITIWQIQRWQKFSWNTKYNGFDDFFFCD